MAQWVGIAAVGPLLLAVAGCATPAYEEVQPRRGAEITFSNTADQPAEIELYLGPDCTGRHEIRNPADEQSKLLPNQARAFTFTPGQPFTVELSYAVKDGYFWNGREQKGFCRQMYTFTPGDQPYAMIFSLGEATCSAELYSGEHHGLVRLKNSEYLTPRLHRVSLRSDGPWCEAP